MTTKAPVLRIPVTEYRYDGDTATTDHVLSTNGGRYRFGIGGVPRGKEGRKVFKGPMVPGPWAYAFGLATVIAANREMSTGAISRRKLAEGTEHPVNDGDLLEFDGVTYTVRYVDGFDRPNPRGEFLKLDPVS